MAVNGLDRFRASFAAHAHGFVLIGGTACYLAMDQVGLAFRATKDLDIVLMLEEIDVGFTAELWRFIEAGGYEIAEQDGQSRRFFRFAKPSVDGFPFMLELFSRMNAAIEPAPGQRAAPVVRLTDTSGEARSLSAILLDDDYYSWIRAGRITVDGLPIVRAEHLVPLKARAWLDLTARRAAGEQIDSDDITKHKKDVFRLWRILDPEYRVTVPAGIAGDVGTFLDRMGKETLDWSSLSIPTPPQEVFGDLRRRYAPTT